MTNNQKPMTNQIPNSQIPQDQNDPGKLIDVDERRVMAALSYVGILVLVPLIYRKNDAFAVLHAKQGLVILGGYIVAIMAVNWIEVVGSLLFLGLALINITALVQTLLGRSWKIPVIYQIANSFRI